MKLTQCNFSNLIVVGLATLTLAATLVFYLLHPLRIGFDQAHYINIAEQLRAGKVLYVDVLDNNPPAICYMSLIPATASAMLNIPAPLCFSLLIWFLSLYSVSTVFYLSRRLESASDALAVQAFMLSIPAFNLLLESNLMQILFQFGQREHIFMLLFLPFFLMRWLYWQDISVVRPVGVLIGALAGCAMCMKPQFVIPLLCTELYWFVQRRSLKPLLNIGFFSALFVLCLYALHFIFLPQAAKTSYFDFILPTLMEGYAYYDKTMIFLCNYTSTESQVVIFAMLFWSFLAFTFARFSPFAASLAVMTASSSLIYFAQGKGWPYHLLPLSFSTFLLQNTMVAVLFKVSRDQLLQLQLSDDSKAKNPFFALCKLSGKLIQSIFRRPTMLAVTFSSIWLIWLAATVLVETTRVSQLFPFDLSTIGYSGKAPLEDLHMLSAQIKRWTKPGDTIAIIADATEPGAATMLQLKRRPATRHLDMAILGPLHYIKEHDPERWNSRFSKHMSQFADELVSDINRTKPKIIFVQFGQTARWMDEIQFDKRVLKNYDKVESGRFCTLYKDKTLQEPL